MLVGSIGAGTSEALIPIIGMQCPNFDTLTLCGRLFFMRKLVTPFGSFHARFAIAWVRLSIYCRRASILECPCPDQCPQSLRAFPSSDCTLKMANFEPSIS